MYEVKLHVLVARLLTFVNWSGITNTQVINNKYLKREKGLEHVVMMCFK